MWPLVFLLLLCIGLLSFPQLSFLSTLLLALYLLFSLSLLYACISTAVPLDAYLLLLMALPLALLYVSSLPLLVLLLECSFMAAVLLLHSTRTEQSLEAALVYLLLSSIAGLVLMYSILLLAALSSLSSLASLPLLALYAPIQLPLLSSVCLLLLSLLFKLGLAPFHLWLPALYDAAHYGALSYLLTAHKAYPLLLLYGITASLTLLSSPSLLLKALAMLTFLLAVPLAYTTSSVRRLYTLSSSLQLAFLLMLPLLVSVAWLSYLVQYMLLVILSLALLSVSHSQLRYISALPTASLASTVLFPLLALIILGLIGIPPTLGFHLKLVLILALLSSTYPALLLLWLLLKLCTSSYYLTGLLLPLAS